MTVSSSANKTVVAGDGVTTTFAFGFIAVDASYVAVIHTDASGNQATLDKASYTLAINSAAVGALWGIGGTVTYPLTGAPMAAGESLTVIRTLSLVQAVSLANQASYGQFASSAEQAIDLLEMQIQQISELFQRAMTFPAGDSAPPATLPGQSSRANQALIFDSTGQPTVGAAPSSGTISTTMQPVVNAASLGAGQTAFGLGDLATKDTSFLNSLSVQSCSTNGTNSIHLSQLVLPSEAYVDQQCYSFEAVADSTGSVTLHVASLAALKLFLPGGVTQAGAGDIKGGVLYIIAYQAALDGGAGGFVIVSALPVVPTTDPWSAGDIKATYKTVADSGWVMLDDGTIGNASSGATNRANADTSALFAVLWNNVGNSFAPVSTGRGVSAAADFAANKTITLPAALGRVFGVAGSGSGLTTRSLGQTVGEEAHALITAELAAHTHSYEPAASGGASLASGADFGTTGGSATTGSTGSGNAHNTMQPTTFVNFMIKL